MATVPALNPATAEHPIHLRTAYDNYIGRENHRMMIHHYQQIKNVLVSYSPNKLGFFWGGRPQKL